MSKAIMISYNNAFSAGIHTEGGHPILTAIFFAFILDNTGEVVNIDDCNTGNNILEVLVSYSDTPDSFRTKVINEVNNKYTGITSTVFLLDSKGIL